MVWKQHRQPVTERAYIILHGFTAHTADNQGTSVWHPTLPSFFPFFFLPILFTVLSRFGFDFPYSFLSILNLTQFRQLQFGWVRRVFFSSPWKPAPPSLDTRLLVDIWTWSSSVHQRGSLGHDACHVHHNQIFSYSMDYQRDIRWGTLSILEENVTQRYFSDSRATITANGIHPL